MKNKLNVKVLLPVVIAIWGIIGYQIYSAFLDEDVTATTIKTEVAFKPIQVEKSDTFMLPVFERDPFLGTLKNTPKKTTNIKRNKAPIDFLKNVDIDYKGLIVNSNNSETIYVVNYNKVQYLLKKGQEVLGLKILSGTDNNLKIKLSNNVLILHKKQ